VKWRGVAGITASLALLGSGASLARSAERPTLTFFVASDSHFGVAGIGERNRALIEQMNALPGTGYPLAMGGNVGEPFGVLFTGDLTDSGLAEEFDEFERFYGLTGKEGLLRFPVFETIGNHDMGSDTPVGRRVRARHGGVDYSWDVADVHFLCLDMFPDARTVEWMKQDLVGVGRDRPLVLFFHYSLEGPYSDFWEPQEKDAFASAIEGRNVLAIFHGHEHRAGHYVWRGHPVFRPGSPKHASHAFLAVRLGVRQMQVAAWDFDDQRWLTSWTVAVRR